MREWIEEYVGARTTAHHSFRTNHLATPERNLYMELCVQLDSDAWPEIRHVAFYRERPQIQILLERYPQTRADVDIVHAALRARMKGAA